MSSTLSNIIVICAVVGALYATYKYVLQAENYDDLVVSPSVGAQPLIAPPQVPVDKTKIFPSISLARGRRAAGRPIVTAGPTPAPAPAPAPKPAPAPAPKPAAKPAAKALKASWYGADPLVPEITYESNNSAPVQPGR